MSAALAEKYRIVRRIGKGGMAEVLEAVAVGAEGFERRVALKRMLPEHGDNPDFARMFVQEARIASLVHHANIAAIFDFGVADGVAFQVMELVDGADTRTLQEHAAAIGDVMPAEVALHVVTEVAHALAYAHAARGKDGTPLGIVHRDVSPRNILVSWHGDVKLTDFGIAFSRDRAVRTRTGITKGTPPYMAPEQTLGGEIDRRTDIFALGCVLHALLAGKSPLSQESNMVTLLSGGAMDLAPGLPDDVRAIVARATRYAKAERYQNGSELAAATGAALHERIAGDPKSMMIAWLDRIRPQSVRPQPRGRLDDLFSPELVLEGTKNDVRSFVVTGGGADPHASTEMDSAQGSHVETRGEGLLSRPQPQPRGQKGPPSSIPPPPLQSPRPLWVLGALGAVLAVAGLAIAWRHPSPGRALLPGPAEASATASSASVAPSAPPTTTPSSAPLGAAGSPPPSGRATSSIGSLHAHATPALSASQTHATPALAPGGATGALVVAGSGALHSTIVVDGQDFGFAPKTVELPVGVHQVSLLGPDNRVVASKSITLTARDTASAPVVWRLP